MCSFAVGRRKRSARSFSHRSLIEVIIGLPQNLFYGAGISACILLLAIPSHEEQDRVTVILDSMDADVAEQQWLAAKLQHLKAGLMSDLLTGRIRVPESISAMESQP